MNPFLQVIDDQKILAVYEDLMSIEQLEAKTAPEGETVLPL